MAEEKKDEPQQPKPERQRPIVMIITNDVETGQVLVNGPLGDKMLCYGMLKMAEKVVDSFEPAPPPQKKILLPN